jgi:hypothetical protein
MAVADNRRGNSIEIGARALELYPQNLGSTLKSNRTNPGD